MLLWVTMNLGNAAEPLRKFDVPVGEAVVTLKRFALPAGREIVFAPKSVAGIRTQAVQGQFTASDALNQMLRETGLVATQERRSGAFAVRLASPPPNSGVKDAAPETNTEAAAGIGTITGRVRNLVTAQNLHRARVRVVQTGQVAYTDATGAYRLSGVPAGITLVEFFYTDLDLAREAVSVPAGERELLEQPRLQHDGVGPQRHSPHRGEESAHAGDGGRFAGRIRQRDQQERVRTQPRAIARGP